MIFYLVTERHPYTIDFYLERCEPSLQRVMRRVTYEGLFHAPRLPGGVYIFSDVERLNAVTMHLANQVWERLVAAGKGFVPLNHPRASMRRYELLRGLFEAGVNDFNIYRLSDGERPRRFPVFLRDENEHGVMLSAPLRDAVEYDAAIERVRTSPGGLEGKVAVELCDTSIGGVHRKYSAFVVGERVIPRHLFFSREWEVRFDNLMEEDEALRREEEEYVFGNPHRAVLRDIFRGSRIEFGRIDYGMLDGRPQVWEINTNPTIFSEERYAPHSSPANRRFAADLKQAFEELAGMGDASRRIWLDLVDPVMRPATPKNLLKSAARPLYLAVPAALRAALKTAKWRRFYRRDFDAFTAPPR